MKRKRASCSTGRWNLQKREARQKFINKSQKVRILPIAFLTVTDCTSVPDTVTSSRKIATAVVTAVPAVALVRRIIRSPPTNVDAAEA